MKRLAIAIALLMVLSSLGAKDISATGRGSTEKEARENAVSNLSSLVFGTSVVSETTTTLSSVSGTSSTGSFTSTSSGLTYGTFIGLEYKNSREDKNGWSVEALIPDSSYNAYKVRLDDSIKTIKSIRSQLEKGGDMDTRKSLYLNLLSALGEYGNYRQVLLFMEHDATLPVLDLDITLQSVATEYQSLLIEEANELQKNYGKVDSKTLEEMLAENRRLQSQLGEQKNEALAQAEAQRISSINEQMRRMLERTGQLTVVKKGASFTEAYGALKKAIEGYKEVSRQYDAMLSDEVCRIEKEYQTERRALENKAYLSAELSGGRPTSTAKAFRDMDLEDLKAQMEARKKEVSELITYGFKDAIQASYDAYAKAMADIQSTAFTSSVSNGDYRIKKGAYDGDGFYWPITLTSNILPETLNVKGIRLDYKSVTGLDPVTGTSNRDAYMDYTARVDEIEKTYLDSFSTYYDFELRFGVTISPQSGEIYLEVYSLDFIIGGRSAGRVGDYVVSGENKWTSSGLRFPESDYDFLRLDSSVGRRAEDIIFEENRQREAAEEAERLRIEREELQRRMDAAKAEERLLLRQNSTIICRNGSGDFGVQLYGGVGLGFGSIIDLSIEADAGIKLDWMVSPEWYVGVMPAVMYTGGEAYYRKEFDGLVQNYPEAPWISSFHFGLFAEAGYCFEAAGPNAVGLRFGFGETLYAEAYFTYALFETEVGGELSDLNLSLAIYYDSAIGQFGGKVRSEYVF